MGKLDIDARTLSETEFQGMKRGGSKKKSVTAQVGDWFNTLRRKKLQSGKNTMPHPYCYPNYGRRDLTMDSLSSISQ
jgi:hypothetical protein